MGVRFQVEPGDVPAYAAARRLGLTEPEFEVVKERLYARGFPRPNLDTGNYDLDAIDLWRRRRHRHLFGNKDAAIRAGVAELEARIQKLKQGLESERTAIDISTPEGKAWWFARHAENSKNAKRPKSRKRPNGEST